jgi:hypothetical protein
LVFAGLRHFFEIDAYRDTDQLNTLEEAKSMLDHISNDAYEAHKTARAQIKDIQDALSDFSNALAKKAAAAGIEDIEKVNSKLFDAYARIFEKEHKKKLSVITPTLISAFMP